MFRLGPVLILVGLIVAMSFLSPVFFTTANAGNVLSQTAVIAILAIGQLFVIVTRGIDLSVGSNLALASVVGALAFQHGASGWLVILIMLASGATVGLVNGGVLRVGPNASPVHHHVGDVEHRAQGSRCVRPGASHSGGCPRSCGRSVAGPSVGCLIPLSWSSASRSSQR